jgi:hypothetical protein
MVTVDSKASLGRVVEAAARGTTLTFDVDLIRRAWRAKTEQRRQNLARSSPAALNLEDAESSDPFAYSYIEQLWTDHIIVGSSRGDYFKVPYSVKVPGRDVEQVIFETPVKVMRSYVKVSRELDMDLIHLSASQLENWHSQMVQLSSVTLLAGPPVAERRRLAKENKALPDGSFPIPNLDYLRRAIKAIGRASNYERVRKWILQRAKALNAMHLVPDTLKKPRSERAGSS